MSTTLDEAKMPSLKDKLQAQAEREAELLEKKDEKETSKAKKMPRKAKQGKKKS